MEKSDKKRILTRVLIVIAALTLLSCCFLGSTFAKYVTNASGSASVGVAKWDVNFTGSGTSAISFGKLSPSYDAWNGTAARQNIIDIENNAAALTITSKSEVDAVVTISISEPTFTYQSGKGTIGDAGAPSKEQALKVISFQYALDENGSAEYSALTWNSVGENGATKSVTLKATTGTATTAKLYLRVVWTSLDTEELYGTGASAENADNLDTWFGENVASVTANLTYSAVQASKLPTT